ncbi:probable tyrosyl-DNA phosphodiesterase [Metopolophium dirhodum]|uniref:probable tyrosyl-DNA phosphodiesterase n=1 Tax=Metopolophium dirhodum TaxID=44670 RepID=UPI00298F5EC7|nr:probable tyrosyl-DNA phosphodiesterase [Metopolophium dirhodum]
MASGSESLKQNPTDPESESLKQKPTGSGSESPKQKPIGSGSESPKQKPTDPESESLKQKPTGSGSESPKQKPTSSGSESPKQKPTGSKSEYLKRKPIGLVAESLKRKLTGPGSESLKRMPSGSGSESWNRKPTGPGSEFRKRKPTGPGSESRKRQPTGPQGYNDAVWKFTKGTVDKKLEKSEPYRIFMTPISCDPGTHTEESTLSFAELLDKSLGDLTESLHLNFMVELGWLFAQYFITDQRGKNMTLLYERCNEDIDELHKKKKLLNVRHKKIINKNAFGHQHSKVSMFAYADGSLRVVVMSANLCEDDWTKYAQGIWVSPKFPLKEEDNKSDGNSKTDFKIDILRYLNSFREPSLVPWIKKIEKVDFSQANVFFIPSVPGKHTEPLWGHLYLKNILKKHACLPFCVPSEWPIIAQCSSLGSLGTTDEEWLKSEFVESLSASTYCDDTNTDNDPIPFNLIFPSVNNVLNSWDGALGGICLPYNKILHEKQLWLKKYMCLWMCHSRKRTKAMPHIKTYCRISPCLTEMSWFLMGSANLSKAAWGRKLKSDEQSNFIMAHEAGVLFLPQFLIGSDTFPIDETEPNKFPYFSLPFDLPLAGYSDTDQPWTISTK